LLTQATFPRSLKVLGIAALWGGTVALDADSFNIDLLHVGLCSIEKSSVVGDSYVLSEELGRQAILEVAQEAKGFVGYCFVDRCRILARQSSIPPEKRIP
jgi:hypothetical protein